MTVLWSSAFIMRRVPHTTSRDIDNQQRCQILNMVIHWKDLARIIVSLEDLGVWSSNSAQASLSISEFWSSHSELLRSRNNLLQIIPKYVRIWSWWFLSHVSCCDLLIVDFYRNLTKLFRVDQILMKSSPWSSRKTTQSHWLSPLITPRRRCKNAKLQQFLLIW